MNEQQLADTYEKVFTNGWRWMADAHHPTGTYRQTQNIHHTYGWFIKEGHPQKSRPVGDSKKMWIAAKVVVEAYIS
jgi:hypothetical protein